MGAWLKLELVQEDRTWDIKNICRVHTPRIKPCTHKALGKSFWIQVVHSGGPWGFLLQLVDIVQDYLRSCMFPLTTTFQDLISFCEAHVFAPSNGSVLVLAEAKWAFIMRLWGYLRNPNVSLRLSLDLEIWWWLYSPHAGFFSVQSWKKPWCWVRLVIGHPALTACVEAALPAIQRSETWPWTLKSLEFG